MKGNGNSDSIFNRIKNISAVGIGNLVANSISGLFWLYLANLLGSEGYGQLGFFLAVMGMVGAFVSLGSINTLIVFGAKNEKIQSSVFFLVLIASCIGGLIIYFLNFGIAVSIYPLGYVIFSLGIFDLLGRKLFVKFGVFMILQRIALVSLALVFYQLIGFEGILLGYSLSLGTFFFLLFPGFRESKIQFSVIKAKSHFMINNYVGHVLKVTSINIDKIMILPLYGASILGPYQLSFQIYTIALIFPSIITQYTLPHDATGSKNLKLKIHTMIFSLVITITTLGLSPFIIPGLFPQYNDSVIIAQIMGFAIIPSTLSMIFTSELLGSEKSRSVALGSLFSIVLLVCGIILFERYIGTEAIAISLVISKASECVYLFYKKKEISQ